MAQNKSSKVAKSSPPQQRNVNKLLKHNYSISFLDVWGLFGPLLSLILEAFFYLNHTDQSTFFPNNLLIIKYDMTAVICEAE